MFFVKKSGHSFILYLYLSHRAKELGPGLIK